MLTVLTQEEKTDGAAARMQQRLERMPESKRAEIEAFLETSDSVRQVMTYTLGATKDELSVLLGILEADLHRRAKAPKINGIRIDLTAAKLISVHPGGDANFAPMENFRRFDEHLYRTPEGSFFIVRPLDPEETKAWIIEHDDEPLARQLFPDDED
jgi:hypothetical protein